MKALPPATSADGVALAPVGGGPRADEAAAAAGLQHDLRRSPSRVGDRPGVTADRAGARQPECRLAEVSQRQRLTGAARRALRRGLDDPLGRRDVEIRGPHALDRRARGGCRRRASGSSCAPTTETVANIASPGWMCIESAARWCGNHLVPGARGLTPSGRAVGFGPDLLERVRVARVAAEPDPQRRVGDPPPHARHRRLTPRADHPVEAHAGAVHRVAGPVGAGARVGPGGGGERHRQQQRPDQRRGSGARSRGRQRGRVAGAVVDPAWNRRRARCTPSPPRRMRGWNPRVCRRRAQVVQIRP